MDLSKLPKLSQTPPSPGNPPQAVRPQDPYAQPGAPPPPAHEPYQPPPDPYAAAQPPVMAGGYPPQVVIVQPGGPEAWMSAAIGALMLLFGPRLLQYLFMSGQSFTKAWTFADPQGRPLTYTQTVFFWADLVATAFAFVLILDGAILLWARSRLVIGAALVLTLLTTAANVVYAVATYSTYGLAIWSALAVVYGVFIAIYQWRLLKMLSLTAAPPRTMYSA